MKLEKLAKDTYEEVKRQARNNVLFSALAPGIGSIIYGYVKGEEKGHPVVGALLGPTGIQGAVAKDTGKSKLGDTIKGNAIGAAQALGGLGALGGAIAGTRAGGGIRGALGGALAGGLGGAVTGLTGGALGGAAGYGLGHLFGEKRKVKKLKRKK